MRRLQWDFDMARYVRDKFLEEYVRKVGDRAGLNYLDYSRIRCVRSYEAKSRSVAARIHSASRALWAGMSLSPHYVIEFVSEVFDRLPEEEKAEVVLHELLHIPRVMGGGLIGHGALDFKSEVRRLLKRVKAAEEV
ncbi:MAG: putative metallopeptidase [Nitrososphaerota archaeon]|nr:putative metallopeptidase [Candidatus Calditenuaceae archaeon]MDW8072823.1 putative metallopeptidase [Nitrososphaerota archaeon]